MDTRKGLYRQGDEFYSPEFELNVDRRFVDDCGSGDSVHWHDYCEVEYVLNGSGEHLINNHRYALGPGSVYLVTPVDFHRVVCRGEQPLELYHIQFGCSVMNEDMMQRIIRTQAIHPGGISCLMTGDLQDTVRAAFEQMHREFEARQHDSAVMLRSCLERLCIMILREAERGLSIPEHATDEEDHAAVNRAVQFIRYNFRSRITLAETAGHVHLSVNYFGELFRRRVGMSFNAYLQKCRLDYACRLLSDTRMNISEIAGESGFRTASYFSEVFRSRFGCSPTTFREKGLKQT